MTISKLGRRSALLTLSVMLLIGCGDDGNEADRVGIAWTCAVDDDCPVAEGRDGEDVQLVCLTGFTGGYCGIPDCVTAADCPQGGTCVLHDDGNTYCFRECVDKPECNRNRSEDLEANCSSSFDFNDPADDTGQKACIPPSSG